MGVLWLINGTYQGGSNNRSSSGQVCAGYNDARGSWSSGEVLKERGSFVIDSSGDVSIDEQVWVQTIDEVKNGWLQGPMEFEDVPLEAPITRRFGLSQKDKLRLIDDYSESGVNSAVFAFKSPVLHTVDTAAAMICSWMTSAASAKADSSLVARTFDLKSAYRQIGLCEAGKKFAHIDPPSGTSESDMNELSSSKDLDVKISDSKHLPHNPTWLAHIFQKG